MIPIEISVLLARVLRRVVTHLTTLMKTQGKINNKQGINTNK